MYGAEATVSTETAKTAGTLTSTETAREAPIDPAANTAKLLQLDQPVYTNTNTIHKACAKFATPLEITEVTEEEKKQTIEKMMKEDELCQNTLVNLMINRNSMMLLLDKSKIEEV